jgi:hypothetical protein
MIVLAAFSRVIPHMLNFSPLGAIALFGAAYFQKKWQAFLIPIAATWLSDVFINNVVYAKYYPSFTWADDGFYWIYGTYLLIVLAGIFILRKITISRIVLASLSSTAIFFIVTNFICWPGSKIYSQDFNGLMNCFAAGIPFLKGTFLGDLSYSAILFGLLAIMQRSIHGLSPASARPSSS